LKIRNVTLRSPVNGFPSPLTATPENGTNAGITVGAVAAAGVDLLICACVSEPTCCALTEMKDDINANADTTCTPTLFRMMDSSFVTGFVTS
jgi:hypothetical protein